MPNSQLHDGTAKRKVRQQEARLQAFFIKTFLRLCAGLSLSSAHKLGRFLGGLFWLLPSRIKQHALINLALCKPEWSAAKRRNIARASVISWGEFFCELGPLWYWPSRKIEQIPCQIEGCDLLEQELRRGRGVLILGSHLGAFEYLSYFFTRYKEQGVGVYRPLQNKQLDELVQQARQRWGCVMIPIEQHGVRTIYRTLKQGKLVALFADHCSSKEDGGVDASFFGQSMWSMTLVARLAQKTGAQVLCAYVERLPEAAGFKIHIKPSVAGIDSPDLPGAVTAMNQSLEACINECPQQYEWHYKRFRHSLDYKKLRNQHASRS